MQFEEIRLPLLEILGAASGCFVCAYQVCQRLEQRHPALWSAIVEEYPSRNPAIPMGQGTGHHFSPASFVAGALAHFVRSGSVPGLRQESLECEGVSFAGVAPGNTGNVVGIWALQAGT